MNKKRPNAHQEHLAVNRGAIEDFLDVQANPNKYTSFDQQQIASKLLKSLKKAKEDYDRAVEDKSLVLCIERLAYVNPKDVQRLLNNEIPQLTIYRRKKDTRHMGLYIKHKPNFYIDNKPTPHPQARNRKPRQTKVKA